MKIAFHLNCLTHGGAERVVTNLAGQFAEHGDEVIVATEWTDPNEYELHPSVRRVHVGLLPAEEGKGRAAKALARRSHLHDFMVREKPDVLVAFARKAIYRSLSACRGTGVPRPRRSEGNLYRRFEFDHDQAPFRPRRGRRFPDARRTGFLFGGH